MRFVFSDSSAALFFASRLKFHWAPLLVPGFSAQPKLWGQWWTLIATTDTFHHDHPPTLLLITRDARPAPPRAKMAAPARPDPEKFQHCPAPPRKKIVLPRPENIDRMFRGKVRGKCSYITKRFCESKTFEQYFFRTKGALSSTKGALRRHPDPTYPFLALNQLNRFRSWLLDMGNLQLIMN